MSNWNEKKREYPRYEPEAFLAEAKAMFDGFLLRSAFDYYKSKVNSPYNAEHFLNWIYKLENGVRFENQKYQPKV